MVGFFNKFYKLEMKIYAKEARRTDGEDEETVLDFLAQYEFYGYLKKWWWIW